MDDLQDIRAPRWRGTLAVLADTALAGAAVWGLQGRRANVRTGMRLLGPSSEIVRQQLGSPGQRLLGVRTVDARTGARVALWRSLAGLGAGVGVQLLLTRLQPASPTDEQREQALHFHTAIGESYRMHSADPAAGEAERKRLRADAPAGASIDVPRQVLLPGAVALLAGLLRRRLVSTAETRRG
jgi:hypothetical protein